MNGEFSIFILYSARKIEKHKSLNMSNSIHKNFEIVL